jgi:hypothetical protein
VFLLDSLVTSYPQGIDEIEEEEPTTITIFG